MESKNEFDDIILEKSNKSEKIKKILLRVIALVILFLVVMIVMKLINTSSTQEVENVTQEQPLEFNSNIQEDIQIQSDPAELEFENIKNTLQDGLKEDNSTLVEENITFLPDNNLEINIKEQIKDNDKLKDEKVVAKESVEKPSEVNKTKNENKNIVQKDNPKKQNVKEDTSDLFENIGNTSKNKLTSGIYVQIFSVSNLDQKSRELAQVRKKGYEYKLYKTMVNGKEIHKVLIGPFKKEDIKKELEKIRADVAKDAFTFTIK